MSDPAYDAWGQPVDDYYYGRPSADSYDNHDAFADGWGAQADPEPKPEPERSQDVTVGLSPMQVRAMEHHEGPALVIAGAGSGKTRTVTARIVRLLRSNVLASEILCLTFTRKAANEMRERVLDAAGEKADKITISTFHSLALSICRDHPFLVGRDGWFSVWDDDTMKRELRRILRERWETFMEETKKGAQVADRSSMEPPKSQDVLSAISDRKSSGANPLMDDEWRELLLSMHPIVPDIVGEYETSKKLSNALDFDDLIWKAVRLLSDNDEIRQGYNDRWTFVMVDEYQDTNDLQETFLQLLVGERKNVMVVGDEDQAIYGWRGANVDHILTFTDRYEGAAVIKLGQNYRSTNNIVEAAARLIEQNRQRTEKRLWSEKGEGWAVEYHQVNTPHDEADLIASMIAGSLDEGYPPSEHAILVRTRMQFIPIQAALARWKIPCKTVGALDLWDYADSRLILAWIKSAMNPRDITATGHCLGNWPRIGASTVETWMQIAREYEGPAINSLTFLLGKPRCGPKTKKGKSIIAFKEAMNQLYHFILANHSPRAIVEWLYEITGIDSAIATAKEKGTVKAQRDAESRDQRKIGFIDLCPPEPLDENGFFSMRSFLDGITMKASAEADESDQVCLSTIHAAKGLEWDHVWGAGCVEGLLPCYFDAADLDEDRLEEERRLGYVLCTRARYRLVLTHFAVAPRNRGLLAESGNRTDFVPKRRSRFLVESMNVGGGTESQGAPIYPDPIEERSPSSGSITIGKGGKITLGRKKRTTPVAQPRPEPSQSSEPPALQPGWSTLPSGVIVDAKRRVVWEPPTRAEPEERDSEPEAHPDRPDFDSKRGVLVDEHGRVLF